MTVTRGIYSWSFWGTHTHTSKWHFLGATYCHAETYKLNYSQALALFN